VMNNLAAAALMLPGAMEVARRTGIKPSKLLIPVAYGSLLGGVATYFTTANIIMSDLLRIATPPQKPLNILDFTPTGGLIALCGILFLGLFGNRLLPEREPSEEQSLARLTGSELEDLYQLNERLWEAQVAADSSLIGKTLLEAEIGSFCGVTVAAIQHGTVELALPLPEERILNGDVLLLVGREEKVNLLAGMGMLIRAARGGKPLSRRGIRFIEVILAPHSPVEGRSLRQIDFRARYRVTVVALKRGERSFRTDVGEISLAPGDSLLVIGTEQQERLLKKNSDFIVIEPNPSDQPVRRYLAWPALAVLLLAIGASIAGVPVYLCMLVGACVLLVGGIVSAQEAYQSIEWQAVFLIAGMYAASLAMV
jgi:uncharacterized protein with PhoU and TrkA domain